MVSTWAHGPPSPPTPPRTRPRLHNQATRCLKEFPVQSHRSCQALPRQSEQPEPRAGPTARKTVESRNASPAPSLALQMPSSGRGLPRRSAKTTVFQGRPAVAKRQRSTTPRRSRATPRSLWRARVVPRGRPRRSLSYSCNTRTQSCKSVMDENCAGQSVGDLLARPFAKRTWANSHGHYMLHACATSALRPLRSNAHADFELLACNLGSNPHSNTTLSHQLAATSSVCLLSGALSQTGKLWDILATCSRKGANTPLTDGMQRNPRTLRPSILNPSRSHAQCIASAMKTLHDALPFSLNGRPVCPCLSW